MKPDTTKSELHPRNKHRARYNFDALISAIPALAAYVKLNPHGDVSIDFSDPLAVKLLNQALLKQFYEVAVWDIPEQYLCPPIPGRVDYLHYMADLMHETHADLAVKSQPLRVLDIGVGANVIYPLLGHREYGWQFVGADINTEALQNAQAIVDANHVSNMIELRLQTSATSFFKGIIQHGEMFAFSMCNPPFHASMKDAQAGTQRKWRGLGKHAAKQQSAKLNFGGQSAELYCAGGEVAFVTAMIQESQQFATQCLWFTTLVSKATTLPAVYRALKKVDARHVKTIEMAQGQKQSRIVAWRF